MHYLPTPVICPWCGKRAEVKRDSAWGRHDLSWIECVNRECRVQPKGRKENNWTSVVGRGMTWHGMETKARLIDAWRALAAYDASRAEGPSVEDVDERIGGVLANLGLPGLGAVISGEVARAVMALFNMEGGSRD